MSGKFALIIGNTEYTDPGLAQLSAPGKDAEDFARVLKDQEICAFDDVNILLNEPEYIVRGTIDEFFDQKKPDDLLVLYFSGHGVRDELGALYLAVKNTNRFRLRSTALKSDFIREAMDQSRSKRQVLILDCCNSGAFAQGTKTATGVSIGTATAFESGYGRIILTASDSTQFAWEGDKVIGETDNSLFTHYLIEGLEGEADLDGDGRITVDELYDFAYEKVRLATPKQTPSKFSSKQQGEIVLRHIMSIEDIKRVILPTYLSDALASPDSNIRLGAVQSLATLLNGKNLGLAHSAREALQRVKEEDDSRQVSQAALQALEAEQKTEEVEQSLESITEARKEVKHSVGEKRLAAEHRYFAQTAIQAKKDATRASSSYLIGVGSLLAIMFGIQFFFDPIFYSSTIKLMLSGLFLLMTFLGTSTIMQLARLRAAWYESMLAMNQLKEFIISQDKELFKAFRWQTSTLPPKYRSSSVSFYQAVEVAMLGGLMFGTAMLLLQQAFFAIRSINWIMSVALGALTMYVQLIMYKRSLK